MTGDPWRYRCPDCESVRIRRRTQLDHVKEVVEDRRFYTSNWTQNIYYCTACRTPTEKLLDVKRGRLVYPGAIQEDSIQRYDSVQNEEVTP